LLTAVSNPEISYLRSLDLTLITRCSVAARSTLADTELGVVTGGATAPESTDQLMQVLQQTLARLQGK
jgi:hypothetical protein